MKWEAGFRTIGLIGPNGIVERDGELFKVAMSHVRNADRTLEGYNMPGKYSKSADGSSADKVFFGNAWGTDSNADVWSIPCSRPLENDPTSALKLNGHFSSEYSGCYAVSEGVSSNVDDFAEEQFDPSRMCISQFLPQEECMTSIINEINGLTAPDKDGIQPLKLVHKNDDEAKGKRKILPTMAVRRKSTTKIKARMCLRGDTLVNFDPTCSPTPYRSALRSVLMLAAASQMKIATLDVSQAFIQASRVAAEDQLLIRVPWYVIIPWGGKLHTVNPKEPVSEEYYFPMRLPLYGLKDSPLRRYLHLCQTLRAGPYRQCRTEVCLFSRHENNEPCAWLVVYVGDILIAYSHERFLEEFISIMARYRTGSIEKLPPTHQITFLGMDLSLCSDLILHLSQKEFISRLRFPNIADIVCSNRFTCALGKVRSYFRAALGSLLRVLQTRFDIPFRIIGVAVRLLESSKTVDGASSMVKEIHKIIRVAKDRAVIIRFGKLPLAIDSSLTRRLVGIRLFVFGDAGYITLPGQKSIESCIIATGRERSRDGIIRCLGSSIGFYVKKIARCARSTIASESAAAGNALELGMWHQASLSELIYGRTFDYRLQTEDALPLCNPFRPFCAQEHIDMVLSSVERAESAVAKRPESTNHECSESQWGTQANMYHANGIAQLKCLSCSMTIPGGAIYTASNEKNEEWCRQKETIEIRSKSMSGSIGHANSADALIAISNEGEILERELRRRPGKIGIREKSPLRVIGLTDSANAFSAISNIQPKSVGKLTKISLEFLRDTSDEAHMSFVDAPFNTADAGAKVNAHVNPFLKLCGSREFPPQFCRKKRIEATKPGVLIRESFLNLILIVRDCVDLSLQRRWVIFFFFSA